MPCPTPVVFLIFRRPDLTAHIFEAIRQVEPTTLLVVADGPSTEAESELCQKARAVTEKVDWTCKVLRDYSDTHLGCRNRVSTGLTWAFEQVEEAIILEDDCLPNADFFTFCTKLLEVYRHDNQIFSICGSNFQEGIKRGSGSFYFSRYTDPWGWATWRRSWRLYNDDLKGWPNFKDSNQFKSIFKVPGEYTYWTQIFDELYYKNIPDSWFYRWLFSCWVLGSIAIFPNVCLVSNIGGRLDGTNCLYPSRFSNLPLEGLVDLEYPKQIEPDENADEYLFLFRYEGKQFFERQRYGALYPWLLRYRSFKSNPLQYIYKKIRFNINQLF
jgi:hypothetical protein